MDVVNALKKIKIPDLRWPGGCFADEYHWRDGIGPRAKRPVTLNTNWGGVPETNAFGTHEFLDFAQLIGADAYINANLGTGSPREMAEWLQYMTSDKLTALTAERARNGHPAPWKIAYFAVGNEAWGCGGDMTPERYVDLFRQYATFLKAPNGARPTIVASGGNDNDTTWTEALISKAPLRNLGAITFHYYTIPGDQWEAKGPSTGFGEDRWISTLAHTLRMDSFIAQNSAVMDKYDPQKKVAFDVDEWGTWYDPETGRVPGFLYQQNTLRDAVVAALNFNIFHRHADRVRMTNIAQMVNVLQAMILTQGPRMVLTPTYHVFRMFSPFQDATLLPTELNAPVYTLGTVTVPSVSLSAARTKDGRIVVALVNLDPNHAMPVSAVLAGASSQRVEGEILTAAAMDARNTFEAPDAVHPVAFTGATLANDTISLTLPAKSVVVLTLN
jgi:alpha-N-arabinofuranosidase